MSSSLPTIYYISIPPSSARIRKIEETMRMLITAWKNVLAINDTKSDTYSITRTFVVDGLGYVFKGAGGTSDIRTFVF